MTASTPARSGVPSRWAGFAARSGRKSGRQHLGDDAQREDLGVGVGEHEDHGDVAVLGRSGPPASSRRVPAASS